MDPTVTRSADPTAQGQASPTRARLVVALQCQALDRAPEVYDLEGLDVVEIGRGKRGEATLEGRRLRIALDDAWMSSRHARLVHVAGGWTFEDLGSRNGSRVNDSVVERAPLADGDLLELGRTMLVFRAVALDGAEPRGDGNEPVHPDLATASPVLEQRFHQLKQLATSDVAILLRGESGTGKEVAARALHDLSGRGGPFVAVNCGALVDSLVQSELFGHRRGAFSGATEDRLGFIRTAQGGTLFLDEIGDLPASSQAVLLRVLQERVVTPVGDTRAVAVDVRVVSATHRDLEAMIAERSFRHDLFARIAGFELSLPPLRQRREDLGRLVRQLLARGDGPEGPSRSLAIETARALFLHAWPLNIRELEQCLRVAATLAGSGRIEPQHLSPGLRQPRATSTSGPASTVPLLAAPEVRDAQLRGVLVELLTQHEGNVSAVARAMGKDRKQIHRWIERLAIDLDAYRP